MTGGHPRDDSVPPSVREFFRAELKTAESTWRSFTKDKIHQELVHQIEVTGAKGEVNGAAFAANGIDASVTGVKLEYTAFDPVEKLKEARARARGELPEQLRSEIDQVRRNLVTVRGEAGQARNAAEEAKDALAAFRREHVADLEGIADEIGSVNTLVNDLINSLGGL